MFWSSWMEVATEKEKEEEGRRIPCFFSSIVWSSAPLSIHTYASANKAPSGLHSLYGVFGGSSYKAGWENGATSWSVSFKGWTMGFGRLQFCDWNVVLKIQILVISLGRGWWGVKWGCWEVIWEVEVGWYYVSSSAPPFSLWLGLSWTYSPKKWLDFKFTKGSLTKRVLKLYLSSGISPMQTFYHNLWFCGTRLVNHESRSARL